MKKWKDNALVGNDVHFVNEFDFADSGGLDGMESRSTSYQRLDEEVVKVATSCTRCSGQCPRSVSNEFSGAKCRDPFRCASLWRCALYSL